LDLALAKILNLPSIPLIMSEKKKLATEFESYVKNFLVKLGFSDVDGARDTFRINGIQVDACGGFDETLLIVECCMAMELKGKSLRSKINELRGKSASIKKGIHGHPKYGKYYDVRYILATRNIEVKRDDIVYANAYKPRIYLWNENFIEYYEDLFGKIEKYAIFNMLGEIGIRPSQQNPISVPAFMTLMAGRIMYNFVMDPKDLLEISYVARREMRDERYYQRILRKDRIERIADYIEDNKPLPNSLIIAFNEEFKKLVRFDPIKKGDKVSLMEWPYPGISYGILRFPKDYRSCWIIDGQHRLYAFAHSKKSYHMPVVAFHDLPTEEQCRIFLDINRFQKPVPPDLVWDLNGMMLVTEEEGDISNSVKQMNKNGPLKHKIYIPSSGIKAKRARKLLKLSGICISIKRNGLARQITASDVANPFYNHDHKENVKKVSDGLNEYFGCVQNKLKEDWNKESKGFVLSNAGIAIMIGLLERIIWRTVKSSKKSPNIIDYSKYLESVRKYMLDHYNSQGEIKKLQLRITSEGGRHLFLGELIKHIARELRDEEFASGMELHSYDEIVKIEGKLKEIIKFVLSKGVTGDWFKTKVEAIEPEMYNRALKNAKKNGNISLDKAYLGLTFGDCLSIIKKYAYLFNNVLWGSDKEFRERVEFEVAFKHISRIRATQSHYTGANLKPSDWDLFDIYMKKATNCLDSILK
jgi:DNA sulfur modification protein DndB